MRSACSASRSASRSLTAFHWRMSLATSQSMTSSTRFSTTCGRSATTLRSNSAFTRDWFMRSKMRPMRSVSSKKSAPRFSKSFRTLSTSARRKRKSRARSSR